MLINFRFRFVGVVRSLYLVPAAMSFAASAVVWRYLYLNGPGYGLINYVISPVRRHAARLARAARPGRSTPSTSSRSGSTPADRHHPLPRRAAAHPGLGHRGRDARRSRPWLQRARYIIWPGVSYMTLLVAIISLLAFTNGSFDLVNILTKGGPLYATQTLIYYIYVNGFSYGAVRLRRRALGAPDRAHRRDPARAPAPLEVDAPMMALSRASAGRSGSSSRRSIGLLLAAPLFYMVAGSLMSNEQLSIQPPQVIPSSLHFENYSDGLHRSHAGDPGRAASSTR